MNTETAINETKTEFPFGSEYLDGKEKGYETVVEMMTRSSSRRDSSVLSIGAGPCDFEAIFSKIGYNVTAVDDLSDAWHKIGENQDRIIKFADEQGIDFHQARLGSGDVTFEKDFDIVCILDVIEHLTDPRNLLNVAGEHLKEGGTLIILTPNAAHLANRIELLFGKPISKGAEFFFWNIGPYRAHIKEYTIRELQTILRLGNYKNIMTRSINKLAGNMASQTNSRPKTLGLKVYQAIAKLRPTFRDTQIASARKPADWTPTEDSIDNFVEQYRHLEKYNLDGIGRDDMYQILRE